MLSKAGTQTDSVEAKGASSTHLVSLRPPAQKQPDQVSPFVVIVNTRLLVTPHHIYKPERDLIGDTKPMINRKRQKQTTRMSTGGLPPQAALVSGIRTGEGKGSTKGSADGTKREE
jgi:hypothetical protein